MLDLITNNYDMPFYPTVTHTNSPPVTHNSSTYPSVKPFRGVNAKWFYLLLYSIAHETVLRSPLSVSYVLRSECKMVLSATSIALTTIRHFAP